MLLARDIARKPGSARTMPVAAVVPLDGYHLTRAQLSALPDSAYAHARRGAAFTFDGAGFLALVTRLREPMVPESRTLYAPSFDHALKDPVENDVAITPSEGNYLSLDEAPWRDAAAMMDELWFVHVDLDIARNRLVQRHLAAGIASDEEQAVRRVEENDLVNGRHIVTCRLPGIHEIVISSDDAAWRQGSDASH